jgi:peroxiredoxin
MIRPICLLPLAVLATACGGTAGAVLPTWERPGLGGAVRPEMGSPQPGEAVPDLALPDLDGNTVSLASMRGSWVVIHFTATWCPFCDSEVGHLGALSEAMAGRGVKTLIVDVEDDAHAWHDYASARVVSSLVALHDASGRTAARFAPAHAQPSFEDRAQAVLDGTLIVDPAGTIRLFLLPDSAHFDPTFRAVREELDRLVPRPVVAVSAAPRTISAGEHSELRVKLEIAPGYHVMSDRPNDPSYVPTRVVLNGAPGVGVGEAAYPAPASFDLAGRPIVTFEGAVEVAVPLDVAADAAPGPRLLRGQVRYQACTATHCLFPASRSFDGTVLIARRDATSLPD